MLGNIVAQSGQRVVEYHFKKKKGNAVTITTLLSPLGAVQSHFTCFVNQR